MEGMSSRLSGASFRLLIQEPRLPKATPSERCSYRQNACRKVMLCWSQVSHHARELAGVHAGFTISLQQQSCWARTVDSTLVRDPLSPSAPMCIVFSCGIRRLDGTPIYSSTHVYLSTALASNPPKGVSKSLLFSPRTLRTLIGSSQALKSL